ncbi:MAG: queuosine precursor transporter [Chlamydiae bacterium]|nr:queuosine precursor transporter [Chlamydiota bacterium]
MNQEIKLQEKSNLYFTFFCVLFVTLLLLSNMTMKLFKAPFFPTLALTSGLITYPITFLITDTVTEIWGEKKAHIMVWLAFSMNILMLTFIKSTIHLPVHKDWFINSNSFGFQSITDYQTALVSVFSVSSYILLGSMVAYMISQLMDIKIFAFLKKKTKGRHLWLRNNASTCISQLIDTFIMDGIVLYWGLKMSLSTCITIGISVYVFKVTFALLDTPIVYLLTHYLKKKLSPDEYKKTA